MVSASSAKCECHALYEFYALLCFIRLASAFLKGFSLNGLQGTWHTLVKYKPKVVVVAAAGGGCHTLKVDICCRHPSKFNAFDAFPPGLELYLPM